MLTLFTFLGRTPLDETAYQRACYEFPDGERAEVAFFGWALYRRLAAGRLVILGTAGSMWDHLFEGDIALGEAGEEGRLAVMEAVARKAVTQELLAPLEAPLGERLGCEVCLRIIPYCRAPEEQTQLLRIMADCVAPRDTVHIDISHGFRHLPMLALLAAFYLEVVKGVAVENIWYGAYDPDTRKAPVHELSGLLKIARWLQALNTYDKDGDYGALSPLLGEAGALLRQAAFFERTTNPVKARETLIGWASREDRTPVDDPAAELFRADLEQRLGWHKGQDRAAREHGLATRYLDKGDYLRAAIYGLEASITAEAMRQKSNLDDIRHREQAAEAMRRSPAFRQLGYLRNAMAHGVRSVDKRTLKHLRDEAGLQRALRDLLKTLRDQA